MYLFSRQAQLAPGNTRAAMTWATGITEKVNQITGLEVSLFSLTFSPVRMVGCQRPSARLMQILS